MQKQSNTYSSYNLSKRVVKAYLLPHKKKIGWAFLCMIIAAAATAANALLIKPVLDEIFVNKNRDMLLLIPLAIFAIALGKAAASYGYSLLMKYVGQDIVTKMQIELFEHLLHSDIAMFNDKSSGNLLSRFTNDIHIIRKDLMQVLTGMVNQFFTLIFLIGVMFYQSAELALIGFMAFPLAIYPIIRLGKRMRKVSHSIQEELEEFTSTLEDTFQGARIVKAYHNEEHEVSLASSRIKRIFELYIKAARIESISSPMMELLSGIAIATVIWYGGYQVLAGETTPGAFFSFITALLMAYKPMKSISTLNTSIQEGLAAIKRLFIVLDTKPTITNPENAEKLQLKDSTIVFKDVVFRYNPAIDKSALNTINLTVPSGKRVALVGASGGGKSTIMNMILRFYDPTSGDITINKQNLRGVTLESLRSNIAVVNQEATLFDTSIAENIAYGNHEASKEDIIAAAKQAAAHEFIIEQSDGYDTPIGQHGLKLSGGQRQRIAIARAMLRNAPILLLDEATSALDNISEQQVQTALNALMENRTTLVIAHRLSTIIECDLIYVIEKGQVVESGTHSALLKKKNAYAKLYNQQFK